jgi:hypothetical protein
MAQKRGGSASEQSCGLVGQLYMPGVSERIYTPMRDDQPTVAHAPIDCVSADAGVQQLRPGQPPALGLRDRGADVVDPTRTDAQPRPLTNRTMVGVSAAVSHGPCLT